MFGSYNERMYLAEARRRAAIFIPASFPGAIIRRHTGTPFMGYAGATYLVQEVLQRAVRCAVPHPAARPASSTRSRRRRRACDRASCRGTTTRKRALDEIVEREPVLVRISAAKRLRDAAERDARKAGEERVTAERAGALRATALRKGSRHDACRRRAAVDRMSDLRASGSPTQLPRHRPRSPPRGTCAVPGRKADQSERSLWRLEMAERRAHPCPG